VPEGQQTDCDLSKEDIELERLRTIERQMAGVEAPISKLVTALNESKWSAASMSRLIWLQGRAKSTG